MSKLGLHVNVIQPSLREFIVASQPTIIKTLEHDADYWREIKAVSPGTFLVGRLYLPEQEQRVDQPTQRGRELAERIMPFADRMRGIYDCWEGYNEKSVNTIEEAKRLNEYQVIFSMTMHDAGHKVAAYSFSTGNPDLGMWPRLLDGLRASDYLALHEYSAPTMRHGESWLCLRYQRVYEVLPLDCRKPLIVSECGIDGGVIQKVNHGWRDFVKPEQYLSDLAWYDKQLQADSFVVGATIFCCGTHDKTWSGFDVLENPMRGMLTGYWQLNKPVYWKPPIVEAPKKKEVHMIPDYPVAEAQQAHAMNYAGLFKSEPTMIVLHGTAGPVRAAINWFQNPKSRVSAHYIVAINGAVFQCVPEACIAWHAGLSKWNGREHINEFSIGIELETDTQGYSDWDEPQLSAAAALCRYLIDKYHIERESIVTHAMVAVPQGRRKDPLGFNLEAFRNRLFGG